MQNFKYLVPSSIDEAIAFGRESGEDARYIGGGTEIVPSMTRRKHSPACLIELSRLKELAGIDSFNGGLRIGASVTHTKIQHSPLVGGAWRALAEASGSIREPQVRNRGTIGGNVASGVSCADLMPPLLAFKAVVRVRGSNGERLIPVEEFLAGPFRTNLLSDELVVDILLPEPKENFGSAFTKLTKFHGSGLSVATVAATISVQDDCVLNATIAIGAAGPTPRRVEAAEAFLKGKFLTEDVLSEVGKLVSAAAEPREGSIRASPTYKRRVLGPLAERTITLAFNRSRDRSFGAQR